MSEIRDRVREMVAQHLYDAVFPGADWSEPSEYEKEVFYDRAENILSIPELAVVDRKAELLEYSLAGCSCFSCKLDRALAKEVQEDMLKAGYVKEVKD